MGYQNDETGDFEKLSQAWGEISQKFGSVNDVLEAFGLVGMPAAQRYGIMFGILTFVCTVSTVIGLLFLGGSFKRIAAESDAGDAPLVSPHDARSQRALLMEQLLEGRDRMIQQNYPPIETTEGLTKLTKMLLSVAPPKKEDQKKKSAGKEIALSNAEIYKQNYTDAYRICQDRPGGPVLSGRPEARFEAYARGFAGCGPYTSNTYRRSYGRVYESLACANHKSDDKYSELFKTRPGDIIGKYVRLEALEVDRHLEDLYTVTSGEPSLGNNSYDPQEIWSFVEDGPFMDAKAMRNSLIIQHKMDEAAFAVINSVTNKLMGTILLMKDDPYNLSIQLEAPIMQPSFDGSREQLETCFLLIDRLVAFGYRRIQLCIDSQDASKRKLALRLGCTLEGLLYKHMIVKESSRDSNIYSLLNSDWKRGAHRALYTKLYGKAAASADAKNELREAEVEEQQRGLKEKKRLEQEASTTPAQSSKKVLQ
jgi:RimJ/RimL family protein N-acetyltransferase